MISKAVINGEAFPKKHRQDIHVGGSYVFMDGRLTKHTNPEFNEFTLPIRQYTYKVIPTADPSQLERRASSARRNSAYSGVTVMTVFNTTLSEEIEMKTLTLACLFASILAPTATAGDPNTKAGDAGMKAVPKPDYIDISQLTPKHDGKKVTIRFTVKKTYGIRGAVPVGRVPSFGIRPKLTAGSPRLSIIVSGDLADLMDRFALLGPQNPAKGLVMVATGKITLNPGKRPSYQFVMRDWKGFRIIPQ